MGYIFNISLRFLLGRSRERFISLISIISIVGVATGVATLIVVIGVMNGFDNELRDRIIGTSSHVVIDKIGGLEDADLVQANIRSLESVVASAAFVNTQGLIVGRGAIHSVMLRGIDAQAEIRVSDIGKFIKKGTLDLDPGNKVIVGSDLAERLMVNPGDSLELINPASMESEMFQVTGIFTSGMYDFDANVVFVSIAAAWKFSGTDKIVSGLSVKIDNVYNAEKVKKQIQDKLGFPYFTRSWMDLNRNLFNALKLEKTAMFVILTLIVLVASLNIASTLIMMVMEKTKDIGILKAIGLTQKGIAAIFTMVGMFIGLIGIMIGTGLGLCLAYILKTYEFIQLPKDVYYISKLPVNIAVNDLFWIIFAAILISFCATFYPARHASRLSPVEALRYE